MAGLIAYGFITSKRNLHLPDKYYIFVIQNILKSVFFLQARIYILIHAIRAIRCIFVLYHLLLRSRLASKNPS